MASPTRAVVVLRDGLNRPLLGAYGGREFETPNLDRFAARALRFERHYAGPLPCIPARHDVLAAARWLERDAPHHERFLLFVDELDPHEPFDTPEPWASRYDPDWRGPRLIWPPYAVGALRTPAVLAPGREPSGYGSNSATRICGTWR